MSSGPVGSSRHDAPPGAVARPFWRRIAWPAIALAALLRLHGAGALPLSGDEAYHWEWSRHLAGAYYDHPGMTAWLIALATACLPDAGEVAVRLPAMLSMLLAAALAHGFARDVARARGVEAGAAAEAGCLAAALVFFVPLPAALSVYMSTDPPLIPLWLGASWALFAALQRGSTGAWLACGLSLGLAASTKLISLQLVATIGAFLVATRAGRAWLRRPQPWLALGVALVAATPMLVWNATHDWLTFRFNFDIRQRAQHASPWHPVVFVAGQLACLTPGFAVLAVLACLRRRLAAPLAKAAMLCVLVPLAGFALVSLRREVGAHWTAAPWTGALVLLAVAFALRDPWTGRRWARVAWRGSWALSLVVLAAAHAFAAAPHAFARLEVAGGQPRRVLRNLFGWPEVGRAVAAACAALRAEPDSQGVFVAAGQYGTAAAIAFYTPGRPQVALWGALRNHGRSYAQWDDWAALRGRDAVFVSKRPLADWEVRLLQERFAVVGPVERIPITVGGEEGNAFYLVRCRRFDGRPPFDPV
ncbi:MAG TPA: glycosyltransferase family 39 protein [Planctomycetota bacterium]|nr:glycosyltransferase family 39 protein [Planctomycetota bacterium]